MPCPDFCMWLTGASKLLTRNLSEDSMSIESLYFKIASLKIPSSAKWSFILSDKLDLSQVLEGSHTQKYTAAG